MMMPTTVSGLSAALVELLGRPQAQRLLGERKTWTRGGCLLLAGAMLLWLGPSARPFALLGRRRLAVGLYRNTSRVLAQHVLVEVGRWYLDGDGVSSKAALFRHWRGEDLRIIGARLEPDPGWRLMTSFPGIDREPEKAARLARILAKHLPRREVLELLRGDRR